MSKYEKNLTMVMAKVNAQATKPPGQLTYHIYGFIGHKLTICPSFSKIQNMFKDKGSKIVKNKHVGHVKVMITSINMVDVYVVTTRSKVTEIHAFQKRE
jgi:hypothetical protein